MSGDEFAQSAPTPVRQYNRRLGSTIDAVRQLHASDPEVVAGFGFDEYFFHIRRTGITTRLSHRDLRRKVGERVDEVVHVTGYASAVLRLELHTVEAVLSYLERARERGVVHRYEGDARVAIQHDATATHRAARPHAQRRRGATHGRDITRVLELFRRQPRVGGESEFQVEPTHRWQVLHR